MRPSNSAVAFAVGLAALLGVGGLVGLFPVARPTPPTPAEVRAFGAGLPPPATEADIQAALAAPPLKGTYGPTRPSIRLPAGDVVLTQPLVFGGLYSPVLAGDSMHGTRLIWDGPADRYPVEFRGCDHPRLSDLTITFRKPAAGGVLVANAVGAGVTNTAAVIERVWVDAYAGFGVRHGVCLDNTAGGAQPDQNGEHHQVRDCHLQGVHYGVYVGQTQAHRCAVRGTSFSACYHGVYARACGSQTVEDCAFAACTRCLTFGDQYGGGAIARRINAEGCKQLARFWSGPGTGVLEDVRCDGMVPFAAADDLTAGDPYRNTYMTAAVMIAGPAVTVRRVQLAAYGQPHPIRLWLGGSAADVGDLQVWRAEGDPAPVALAYGGPPRRWEFNLLGTVMTDGQQPTEPFAYTK